MVCLGDVICVAVKLHHSIVRLLFKITLVGVNELDKIQETSIQSLMISLILGRTLDQSACLDCETLDCGNKLE